MNSPHAPALGLAALLLMGAPHLALAIPVGQHEREESDGRLRDATPEELQTPASPASRSGIHPGTGSPQGSSAGGPVSPDGSLPTAPIPEPATMALVSMGLISLGAVSRKVFGKRDGSTPAGE